ncbi:MAG TPA: NAD-dependent epimerase/dehydratase family protein, partial [Polyangia bacterium]
MTRARPRRRGLPALAGGSIAKLPPRASSTIAVLGAGGFIGSHLVPALAAREGTSVLAVDLSFDKLTVPAESAGRVERRQASLSDPGVIEEITARAGLVVSLTALCNPALYNTRPLEVIDANYTDLVPLVKLCAARGRRLIHFSTCEVYGRQALDRNGRRQRKMDEESTMLALGPVASERWSYAAAKQLLERVIWAHGRHADLPFTIVRPFNVIGPRMDFIPGVDGEGIPRVLASFMHALMTGEDLLLVDGGRQRRAFMDVGEFVDAVMRIIDRPRACDGQILNLGSGVNDVSTAHLARAIIAAYRAARPGAPRPRVRSVPARAFYGDG